MADPRLVMGNENTRISLNQSQELAETSAGGLASNGCALKRLTIVANRNEFVRSGEGYARDCNVWSRMLLGN
jgi:hypothetical protein